MDNCNILLVKHLQQETSANDLNELFSKYGEVMKVKVVASGHQRSLFGIIVMEEVNQAMTAMSSLNGHKLNDRPISVSFCPGKLVERLGLGTVLVVETRKDTSISTETPHRPGDESRKEKKEANGEQLTPPRRKARLSSSQLPESSAERPSKPPEEAPTAPALPLPSGPPSSVVLKAETKPETREVEGKNKENEKSSLVLINVTKKDSPFLSNDFSTTSSCSDVQKLQQEKLSQKQEQTEDNNESDHREEQRDAHQEHPEHQREHEEEQQSENQKEQEKELPPPPSPQSLSTPTPPQQKQQEQQPPQQQKQQEQRPQQQAELSDRHQRMQFQQQLLKERHQQLEKLHQQQQLELQQHQKQQKQPQQDQKQQQKLTNSSETKEATSVETLASDVSLGSSDHQQRSKQQQPPPSSHQLLLPSPPPPASHKKAKRRQSAAAPEPIPSDSGDSTARCIDGSGDYSHDLPKAPLITSTPKAPPSIASTVPKASPTAPPPKPLPMTPTPRLDSSVKEEPVRHKKKKRSRSPSLPTGVKSAGEAAAAPEGKRNKTTPPPPPQLPSLPQKTTEATEETLEAAGPRKSHKKRKRHLSATAGEEAAPRSNGPSELPKSAAGAKEPRRTAEASVQTEEDGRLVELRDQIANLRKFFTQIQFYTEEGISAASKVTASVDKAFSR